LFAHGALREMKRLGGAGNAVMARCHHEGPQQVRGRVEFAQGHARDLAALALRRTQGKPVNNQSILECSHAYFSLFKLLHERKNRHIVNILKELS
jgi:hypothetical protein